MDDLELSRQYGILSVMQEQLDKIITDSETLNEDDAIYYHAIKKLIDFKLNEDEVKRQFKDFQDVIIATAKMDFSQRIHIENEKDLFSYIACGLNMLNEELEDQAMPKAVHESVMEYVIKEKPDYVILTDASAKIIYISGECDLATGYSKDQLLNQDIQNLFAYPVHFTNQATGEIKSKEVNMVLSDASLIPVILSLHEIPYYRNQQSYYLYIFKKKEVE